MKAPHWFITLWHWLWKRKEKTQTIRPQEKDVFNILDFYTWKTWPEIQKQLEQRLGKQIVPEGLYQALDSLITEQKIAKRVSSQRPKTTNYQFEYRRVTLQ